VSDKLSIAPKSKAELFVECGGKVSALLLGIGFAAMVAALPRAADAGVGAVMGFPAVFLCMGASLFWYTARQATDAMQARAGGREMRAVVERVEVIRQQNKGLGSLRQKWPADLER